jgi:hypothetical protein
LSLLLAVPYVPKVIFRQWADSQKVPGKLKELTARRAEDGTARRSRTAMLLEKAVKTLDRDLDSGLRRDRRPKPRPATQP